MPLFAQSEHDNRILLALRLGWTVAETYGRLQHGRFLWRSASSSSRLPRLFISDLNPTSGELFWVSLQRLVYLTHKIFATPKESSTSSFLLIDISKYPKVDALLKSTEKKILTGKGKLPSILAIYDEFNQWSLQIWAMLDAEDSILADAATLGARLADTFWQLHFSIPGQPVSKKQTWQHLLKQQRLIATIKLVRRVEDSLPDYVGSVIRYSLWEWSIANELIRNNLGRLDIANSMLYRFRSLGWMRVLRKRITNKPSTNLVLHLEEHKNLQRQLKNQIDIWERLIFDRSPAYLLIPTDWQQVRCFSLFLYIITVVIITTLGALIVAGLTLFVKQLLDYLLPFFIKPNQFKDQLTLITTLVSALLSVIAFLLTQFRQYLDRLRNLYNSIYHWVLMRKLEQRCLCYWNGKTKSLFWVWLQRLLRAEY